ncbi:hypothetical protein BC941DRAFT_439828 [Chlamydoabsidia padenii]|nr:hypothetical protein BC941DRAFT_439828 [Chlamydoabsidia padenii]
MGKKHTAQNLLDADEFEIQPHQHYARSLGPRGNHQHEVEFIDGTKKLVTMPPRFRNLVWVKRGHFVVVDPSLGTVSEKVGGEIVQVLFPKHIKALQQAGQWPAEFSNQVSIKNNDHHGRSDDDDEDDDEDNDDDLFVNNNRPVLSESESSSDEEED